MNRSSSIEPTKYLTLANKEQIEVASLPKEIRYEVETLDNISQNKLNKLVELEILELATQSQMQKIVGLLTNHLKQKEEPANDEDD